MSVGIPTTFSLGFPDPFRHSGPFGPVWFALVPFGSSRSFFAIQVLSVQFWCFLVPFGASFNFDLHSGPFGPVWSFWSLSGLVSKLVLHSGPFGPGWSFWSLSGLVSFAILVFRSSLVCAGPFRVLFSLSSVWLSV